MKRYEKNGTTRSSSEKKGLLEFDETCVQGGQCVFLLLL